MTRKYEQRRRAEQQEGTRQRIVEAAVALHGRDGPARTTMSAVAERAGVQRNTVYRHFPDERSLLHACSAHFFAEHPMPDPEPWREVADPAERLSGGLRALYAFFEATEGMQTNVIRDMEVNPHVAEVNALRGSAPRAAIRSALLDAWPDEERSAERVALLDLALGFRTWQSLVRGSGLSSAAAADLMTGLVSRA